MNRPLVVIKVGGSLLDWPDLPSRLATFLASRRNDRIVLVVGGGRFADVLRDLDETHAISEEVSHALALRVLDLTAHVLAKLIPATRVIDELASLDHAWAFRQVPILAPRKYLDNDDRSTDPLPHSWTTTTDSIAARIAVRLRADELILLKSVSFPPRIGWDEAAGLGLVDPVFPVAVVGVPVVRFCNFREPKDSRLIGTSHLPT